MGGSEQLGPSVSIHSESLIKQISQTSTFLPAPHRPARPALHIWKLGQPNNMSKTG